MEGGKWMHGWGRPALEAVVKRSTYPVQERAVCIRFLSCLFRKFAFPPSPETLPAGAIAVNKISGGESAGKICPR